MKPEHRAVYLELGQPLCGFCRFGEPEGYYCDDDYYSCKHPLTKFLKFEDIIERVQEGDDCWAFRPRVSWEVAHGMVHNWEHGKDIILNDDLMLKRGERAFG